MTLRTKQLLPIAVLLAMLSAHAAEPVVDFVVVKSDTLISLSNNVLVSPSAWREIATLNRLPNPNRIVPGQVLKIPTRLLRSKALEARIVSANGDVRVADTAAVSGATVAEGQQVQTGPASSAVIELADGSRVRLPPSSLAQVAASRQFGERAAAGGAPDGWFAGTLRVLRGSVEVFATKVLRAKPLEVVTPTAVVGVRGTRYRVSIDDGANDRTHGEVIEGSVQFETPKGAAGALLATGFGAAADASGAPPTVAKLLPAPDLSPVPERFEKPLVRFALPAETVPLRLQVAADAAFDKIVLDQRVEAGGEVRIADLADAQWHLRARRVDVQGIEGYDASRAFVLKARPQPPAYRTPRADSKQQVGNIEFAWAPNAEAPQARLQIAEDAAFTKIVQERAGLTDASLRAEITQPGTYFWRVASVRASGDQGPFNDVQRFELRPFPTPASVGRSADGSALNFQWSGRAQDRQQVELASDPEFTQIVAQAELTSAEWAPPVPSRGGRYYFRYRSVEPDGYVTPFSDKLIVDVPRDWTIWLLLLPLVMLL